MKSYEHLVMEDKHLKKLLSLLLVAIMAFAIVACTPEESSSSSEPESSESTTLPVDENLAEDGGNI